MDKVLCVGWYWLSVNGTISERLRQVRCETLLTPAHTDWVEHYFKAIVSALTGGSRSQIQSYTVSSASWVFPNVWQKMDSMFKGDPIFTYYDSVEIIIKMALMILDLTWYWQTDRATNTHT